MDHDQDLATSLREYDKILHENNQIKNFNGNLQMLKLYVDSLQLDEPSSNNAIRLVYYLIANLDDRIKKLEK